MKNLVIGAAIGYTIEQISIFIKSLRFFDKDCDVKIVIDSASMNDDIAHLFNTNRIDVFLVNSLQYIPTAINNSRFIVFHDIVFSFGDDHSYKNILLTDIRDVCFQGAPFSELPDSDFLHFALEDTSKTIGTEPFNRSWIINIFGEEVLNRMADNRIVCAGTTLGSFNQIKIYLALQSWFFNIIFKEAPHLLNTMFDQGVHNYMAYLLQNNFSNLSLCEIGQTFSTIGIIDEKRLDFDMTRKLTLDGNFLRAPIIHQYDRHVSLYNVFSRLFR